MTSRIPLFYPLRLSSASWLSLININTGVENNSGSITNQVAGPHTHPGLPFCSIASQPRGEKKGEVIFFPTDQHHNVEWSKMKRAHEQSFSFFCLCKFSNHLPMSIFTLNYPPLRTYNCSSPLVSLYFELILRVLEARLSFQLTVGTGAQRWTWSLS